MLFVIIFKSVLHIDFGIAFWMSFFLFGNMRPKGSQMQFQGAGSQRSDASWIRFSFRDHIWRLLDSIWHHFLFHFIDLERIWGPFLLQSVIVFQAVCKTYLAPIFEWIVHDWGINSAILSSYSFSFCHFSEPFLWGSLLFVPLYEHIETCAC